jgi:large subunit ribosomal protein L25
VPVHVIGDTAPDTLVSIELNTVSLTAAATNIPESIEVDVTGRGAGEGFTAGELTLPSGATLVTDETALVVNLMQAPTAEALEAELSEAEAEAGIEREESDEEKAAEEGAAEEGESAPAEDASSDES